MTTPDQSQPASKQTFPHLLKRSTLFISPYRVERLFSKNDIPSNAFYTRLGQAAEVIFGQACKDLKFPVKTLSTAMMLVQHYCLFNGNNVLSTNLEITSTCLLIASKIEDTPKKSKDIIACLYHGFKYSPTKLEEIRIHVLHLERAVLETLGFDFRQTSPQYYVIKISKDLRLKKEVAKLAWDISIDAFSSLVYLYIPTHTVALASIVLAAKLSKDESIFPLNSESFESTRYKTNLALLEFLELYLNRPSNILRLVADEKYKDVYYDIFVPFKDDISRAIENFQISHRVDKNGRSSELAIRSSKLSNDGAVRYVLGWD